MPGGDDKVNAEEKHAWACFLIGGAMVCVN